MISKGKTFRESIEKTCKRFVWTIKCGILKNVITTVTFPSLPHLCPHAWQTNMKEDNTHAARKGRFEAKQKFYSSCNLDSYKSTSLSLPNHINVSIHLSCRPRCKGTDVFWDKKKVNKPHISCRDSYIAQDAETVHSC